MKNKRNKIANFLSIVLLLGTTVFMLSCETDETIDSNPNKVIQGEYLTFNELKSVDFNVVERIEKLNLEQDVLSKEESIKLNNLFFDKSLVLKLTTKTSTSYTFAVSSDDFLKNQIYNLVVTKYNDNKITQHLVSYFVTSTGEFKINNAINLKLGAEFYQNKTDGCAPRLVTETEEDTSSCIYLSCKGYLDGKPLSHSFGDTSCGFYGDPMLGARRECTTNTITTWSYDCQSGGGGGVTDTGTDYPVGGGTNGSAGDSTNNPIEEATTITSPVYLLPASLSKSLTIEEREWLFDENNKGAYDGLVTYLSTDSSPEAETFAKSTISILSNISLTETQKLEQFKNAYDIYDPLLPQTAIPNDYDSKIKHYIDYFKKRGNHEFANYLESLLPLNISFSNEDFAKLYETIREQKLNYFYALLQEIGLATFDAFKPVIEMALWEVGGTVALKVLSKLPVRYLTTPIKNVIARLKAPTSTAFSNLKHAKKYGIQSYKNLKTTFDDLGLSLSKEGVERHHLIEVRFFKENTNIRAQLQSKFGANTDDWLCIIVEKTNKLTQSEHYILSQKWLKAIGKKGQSPGTTGFNSDNVPFNVVIKTAKDIYVDYPEILKALGI